MHKISNLTGSARHGWDKITTPSMGFGIRPHSGLPLSPPHKQAMNTTPANNSSSPSNVVTLSFNVPFSSNLAGPDVEDTIHATEGAFDRWTHPKGTPDDAPFHQLPVHASNVETLRRKCRELSEAHYGRVQASVTSSEPKPIPGLQRDPLKALVTNVCISGESDVVYEIRGQILSEMPICMKCATVDVDYDYIMDRETDGLRASVLEHINVVASYTGTDIFLLRKKQQDIESASFNGTLDTALDNRLRIAIYGDVESSEHAKTRVLIMIDQILKRTVDSQKLENSLHFLICGRFRKNIKYIESQTNTAIYFPPPFTRIYGYIPKGAKRRSEDEVFITGENMDDILRAKKKLHDLVRAIQGYVKDIHLSPSKIDNILLDRLDKVRKIMEINGSYVLFPQLGSQRGTVRVQGTEILHVERTVRELMALAGEFYSASWWITHPDPNQRTPTPNDIRMMLSDICINSGADISFEKLNFHINGSDDAVKAALSVISGIPFVRKAQSQMRVKIELANDHKEFVSGKKNGKINKIMSQSNVQIIFDQFNEYNFCIDVCGPQYEALKNGLDLVEQEMPASISFHVPDQYHKRIIGIGGSHIQRIMKKYSVFVKFSNAMDRGGIGKEDDDIKVDNVICRTPARNATNLDLVKQEIMDMVEKCDAEFTSQQVVIDRLYHRELIARLPEIEELEKKWNCKVSFPSTEMASDVVTVSGPEYQVPRAVDEFLGMVPDKHQIVLPPSSQLTEFLKSSEFGEDVLVKMKTQYEVDVHVVTPEQALLEELGPPSEMLLLCYTRNNAGGLKDAIDFLIFRLVPHGLDATAVKGTIPRPKSDSFEDSLLFFESKLLQRAEPPVLTDSPTRSVFGDDAPSERSIFEKLRKPGSVSSFSSFLDRRKNGSSSPGSIFKHASSNASRASLASLESRESGYRNIWNDSGVILDDDTASLHSTHARSHSFYSNGWSTAASSTTRLENYNSKFPFGLPNTSSSSVILGGSAQPGDVTPKSLYNFDGRGSVDSGGPSTSNSLSAYSSSATTSNNRYPAPIGPPASSSLKD